MTNTIIKIQQVRKYKIELLKVKIIIIEIKKQMT